MSSLEHGMRAVVLGVMANLSLAVIKILTGVVGKSYALIADGIESTADVVIRSSSGRVCGSRANRRTRIHPYGHGKAESIAGVIAALGLLAARASSPRRAFTRFCSRTKRRRSVHSLVVLLVVIGVKEFLARRVLQAGHET